MIVAEARALGAIPLPGIAEAADLLKNLFGGDEAPTPPQVVVVRSAPTRAAAVTGGLSPVWLVGGLVAIGLLAYLVTR